MKPFSTGLSVSWFRATRLAIASGALAFTLSAVTSQAAVFLDLFPGGVTPGSIGVGTFAGTLGGISVSGSITGPAPAFAFNAPSPLTGGSTTDGSSPQFSYGTVFSPTVPLTDRVGFTYTSGATDTVVITFSSPVTNPVFHFANFSGVAFNFGPTPSFSSLTLLAGNGGAGDGIDPSFGGAPYSFAQVQDLVPGLEDGIPPTVPPPIAGPRAAYASVQINGTFSTIVFVTDGMGPPIDNGSFTISIPEPGSAMLALLGVSCPACFMRRRR